MRRGLVRAPAGKKGATKGFEARGTVLITGGTGALGAQVARWYAQHGAEHLLLVSRPRADARARMLCGRSSRDSRPVVSLVACDVSERRALEELLSSIPREYPLTAVVHAAGTLDDGLLGFPHAGAVCNRWCEESAMRRCICTS